MPPTRASSPPGSAVLVATDRQRTVSRAVRRARATGEEVVVGWTGPDEPTVPAGVRVLPLFPLGPAYAWNRALLAATAPVVRLVGEAGTAFPRPFARQALLRAGGLDHGAGSGAAVEAALRLRPRTGAVRVVSRVLRARGTDLSPAAHLALLPPDLPVDRDALVPLPASHRAKTHFLYAAGRDLLHLYVAPHERLRRSVDEREQIRQRVPAGAVPALVAVREARDCLWVLERRVEGEHLSGPPSDWYADVLAWLVVLAGPPGPPLVDDPGWREHAVAALETTPEPFRARVATAFQRSGALPSRHAHGDLQPRNVLRTPTGFACIDVEGAVLHGLPGLDVLFCALMAGGRLDQGVLAALADGRDPAGRPVLAALAELDVGPDELPDVLLSAVAGWALGDARRARRLGAPTCPPAMAGLWEVVAPLLGKAR